MELFYLLVQKKGCWMQVQVETDTIQVTFKDYGFFVPKTGL